ncbi:MAG: hypothetical protein L6416_08010 [Candidatus Omnitrophica bacterium]|nr:hypothetical protein [Candidatus Omnitrophota bacterium]
MKYLMKIFVCILIGFFLFGINKSFSEEKQGNILAESEKLKNNREEYLNFVKNLDLKETIILGSQIVDKYGTSELYGFFVLLGERVGSDMSAIPKIITLALNEELNPKFKKILVDGFKHTDSYGTYEDGEQMLPHFLKFIEDKSKDQKTKVVLLEIIGCWFDGYKQRFADPLDEEDASEKSFKLVHKQANITINSLNKIIKDKSINKEVSAAAGGLYDKIRQIYLDENNVLPVKCKNLKTFKQVKSKLKKNSDILE